MIETKYLPKNFNSKVYLYINPDVAAAKVDPIQHYLTDYQVCLLAGILITVWPFSPNGNFFNNWLAIIYSLPIGFYLQSIYSKKIRDYKKPA